MDEIIPAFETTLFDPTLSDACVDLAELGIDSLLDEGICKSIPVLSLLIGVGKTSQNIHDRNLLKQTIRFINTFNEKKISAEKINKYKHKLTQKPKFAEDEIGRVLILLNSNVDLKKSELMAKFYRAYVDEQISWEQFCEFSDITSRLFISDLSILFEISSGKIKDTSDCASYKIDRLSSLGLLNTATKSMVISDNNTSNTMRYVNLNELGEIYCSLART